MGYVVSVLCCECCIFCVCSVLCVVCYDCTIVCNDMCDVVCGVALLRVRCVC